MTTVQGSGRRSSAWPWRNGLAAEIVTVIPRALGCGTGAAYDDFGPWPQVQALIAPPWAVRTCNSKGGPPPAAWCSASSQGQQSSAIAAAEGEEVDDDAEQLNARRQLKLAGTGLQQRAGSPQIGEYPSQKKRGLQFSAGRQRHLDSKGRPAHAEPEVFPTEGFGSEGMSPFVHDQRGKHRARDNGQQVKRAQAITVRIRRRLKRPSPISHRGAGTAAQPTGAAIRPFTGPQALSRLLSSKPGQRSQTSP